LREKEKEKKIIAPRAISDSNTRQAVTKNENGITAGDARFNVKKPIQKRETSLFILGVFRKRCGLSYDAINPCLWLTGCINTQPKPIGNGPRSALSEVDL
jgi:hypothetical protein